MNNTEKLLFSISSKLSARRNLSKVEYVVSIYNTEYDENDVQVVMLTPNVSVQQGRSRRPNCTIPILQYVCNDDTILDVLVTSSSQCVLLSESLYITGMYQYKLSRNKLRRKWVRIF